MNGRNYPAAGLAARGSPGRRRGRRPRWTRWTGQRQRMTWRQMGRRMARRRRPWRRMNRSNGSSRTMLTDLKRPPAGGCFINRPSWLRGRDRSFQVRGWPFFRRLDLHAAFEDITQDVFRGGNGSLRGGRLPRRPGGCNHIVSSVSWYKVTKEIPLPCFVEQPEFGLLGSRRRPGKGDSRGQGSAATVGQPRERRPFSTKFKLSPAKNTKPVAQRFKKN